VQLIKHSVLRRLRIKLAECLLIVHLEHLSAPSWPHLAKQHTPKHTTPCSRLLLLALLLLLLLLLRAMY
jgi:hypothetical protein